MKVKVVCSLAIVLFSLMSNRLNAALTNGSAASDFSVTDINGNTFDLSDMLAQGKHVIVNFGAAWSPSSWKYAMSETLNDVYELYGNKGMNNLVVLYIESDVNTSTACIKGSEDCNSSSMGDWTQKLNHPIINISQEEAELLNLYQVDKYPTIYGISSDWKVTNLGQANHATIMQWMMGEENLQATNYKRTLKASKEEIAIQYVLGQKSGEFSKITATEQTVSAKDEPVVLEGAVVTHYTVSSSVMLNFLNETYNNVQAEMNVKKLMSTRNTDIAYLPTPRARFK